MKVKRKYLACCPRNSASSSRGETTKITHPIGMTTRNLLSLTLTNIHALGVVNKGI